MLKNIALFTILITAFFASTFASERLYVNSREVDIDHDLIALHIGDNVWILTSSLHRNDTGLFTYERDIKRDRTMEYQRKWKCPYCNQYWPIGTPCQNADCPSKYKP